MIIPHAKIDFHILIFIRRDMHSMVSAVRQILSNHKRILFICFNSFSLRRQYCGRCKDDTPDSPFHSFMVQRISQASSFIAAENVAVLFPSAMAVKIVCVFLAYQLTSIIRA